jgi:hypothetical protein
VPHCEKYEINSVENPKPCNECQIGYTLQDNTCVPLLSHCEEFDFSRNGQEVCLECEQGYSAKDIFTLNAAFDTVEKVQRLCLKDIPWCAREDSDDSEECEECLEHYFLNWESTVCTPKIEHCLVFTDEETCAECQTGYNLTDNKCTPRIPGCTRYLDDDKCIRCQIRLYDDEEYYYVVTDTCTLTPTQQATHGNAEHCVDYHDQECHECEEGYNRLTHELCTETTKHCLENESGMEDSDEDANVHFVDDAFKFCNACEQPYQPDLSHTSCVLYVDHCQHMTEDERTCEKCDDLYHLTDNDYVCETNCAKINPFQDFICDECKPGFHLAQDKRSCLPICESENEDGTCEECLDIYQKTDSGTCELRCAELNQEDHSLCDSCRPFHLLSADKKQCVRICKTFANEEETLCAECVNGYMASQDQLSCITIFHAVAQNCQELRENDHDDPTQASCAVCSAGEKMKFTGSSQLSMCVSRSLHEHASEEKHKSCIDMRRFVFNDNLEEEWSCHQCADGEFLRLKNISAPDSNILTDLEYECVAECPNRIAVMDFYTLQSPSTREYNVNFQYNVCNSHNNHQYQNYQVGVYSAFSKGVIGQTCQENYIKVKEDFDEGNSEEFQIFSYLRLDEETPNITEWKDNEAYQQFYRWLDFSDNSNCVQTPENFESNGFVENCEQYYWHETDSEYKCQRCVFGFKGKFHDSGIIDCSVPCDSQERFYNVKTAYKGLDNLLSCHACPNADEYLVLLGQPHGNLFVDFDEGNV